MRGLEQSQELAAAGSSFGDHSGWLATTIAPLAPVLERRFLAHLKRNRYERALRPALASITPGAAALSLLAGEPLGSFLEQVQYSGRRLAKLGLTPAAVIAALGAYDALLEAEFKRRDPESLAQLDWVRNQLQFLVVLTLNNTYYQVREAESRAFYELSRTQAEAGSPEEMLTRLLGVLREYTGAGAGTVVLLDEKGTGRALDAAAAPLMLSRRRSEALLQPRQIDTGSDRQELALGAGWRESYRTVWSVPLLSDGMLRGVLQLGFSRKYQWLPRERELLLAATARCWQAAEKARLSEDLARREAQVRRLAEHMVDVEEAERRRISRELHDEAGQGLLCMRLQLEMLERDLPPEASDWRTRLGEIRQLTEHTIIEIRRLIADLSPAVLEQIGLAAGLRQLVMRFRKLYPAEVKLRLPRRLDLPRRLETIVYRLVQEVLNNIAKYSHATKVNLTLDSADGYFRMCVEDDGVGFDVAEATSRPGCHGLAGLRERVALVGGALRVKSLPKAPLLAGAAGTQRPRGMARGGRIGEDRHGTAIWVELPLSGPAMAGGEERRQAG